MTPSDTLASRYEYEGQIAVPMVVLALMSQQSTHFLMLSYLALAKEAQLKRLSSADKLSSEIGVSAVYVKRAIRLLCKLGLIRVFGKAEEQVVEIMYSIPDKALNALKGLAQGTVKVDAKSEKIVHKKSGRTLDLTNMHLSPERKPFSTENEILLGESRSPERKFLQGESTAKAVTPAVVQGSLFAGDRKSEGESGAGNFPADIVIDSIQLDSTTTNTRSTGKRKGRPTFIWTVGQEPDVDEVWTFWRDTLYPKRKTPNADDFSRIRCRLRDGATVEEMKSVVLHAKNDAWLNGTDPKNKRGKRYDSVEVLFNSHAKFEKYRDDAESSKTAVQRDARGLDKRLRHSDKPFESEVF